MYKKSIVHYMTKMCVDILFYVGLVCCLLIPFANAYLCNYFNITNDMAKFMIVTLLLSGISSVYILWQLKIIFKTLLDGNPFILENVNCLRKIAVTCLFIAFIYFIKLIILPTISTVVIIAIFVIASLLCLTLKDLFKQSIYYKDENDLTV
jgi:hypothetical protein